MSSEFTPFVAASMREMLLDMLEKHPEIFDRPTRYPEGRAEFLKQKEPKGAEPWITKNCMRT